MLHGDSIPLGVTTVSYSATILLKNVANVVANLNINNMD